MIPLIVNWGGEVKRLFDAGLMRCPQCHAVVGMEVWRTAKTAGAYYLKLAKWGKHYWLVCPVCQAGAAVPEADLPRLRLESSKLPSNVVAIQLCDFLTSSFEHWVETLSNAPIPISAWLEETKERLLAKRYPRAHVEYVIAFWVQDNWTYLAPLLEAEAARQAPSSRTPTDNELEAHLRTLGLSLDQADPASVKAAYRKMAINYHPDLQGKKSAEDQKAASAKMVAVNVAFDVLSKWADANGQAACPETNTETAKAETSPSCETSPAAETEPATASAQTAVADKRVPSAEHHRAHGPVHESPRVRPAKRQIQGGSWAAAMIVLLILVGGIALVGYLASRPYTMADATAAIERTPTNPNTWKTSRDTIADARAAIAKGDLTRADGILQNLRNATPSDAMEIISAQEFAMAYCMIGLAYNQGARYSDAIVAYQRAIAIKPVLAEAYWGMGVAYNGKRRYSDAIVAYQRAIAIAPDSTNNYLGIGFAYRQQWQYKEAVAAYQKALSIQPNSAAAYLGMGHAYRELWRDAEAVAAYQKALSIRPNSADAYQKATTAIQPSLDDVRFWIGWKGRYTEALAYFQQAIAIHNSADAYLGMGSAYRGQGRYQEALAAYQKAIAIQPNFVDAYLGMGDAYEKLNRYPDAIAAYEESVRFQPTGFLANEARQALRRLRGY